MFATAEVNVRKGMIAVQVALLLVALSGVAALALDGGMLMTHRRRVQGTADAAAYAAAVDLYRNYTTNGGVDKSGTAAQAAQASAAANGYSSDGVNSTVQVNIPPTSGPNAGRAGYAEVIVTYNMPRGFSGLWSSARVPVQGRAVARGLWASIANGIILLSPSGRGALTDVGNGTVTVNGASIVVDSSNNQAVVVTGNGTITAPQLEIAGSPGDVISGNGHIVGGIDSGVTPTVDPLRYITPPDPNSLVTQSNSKITLTGNTTRTLNPGRYVGGISISANARLTLNPGTYYLDGGGFSSSGNAQISGGGVMLYNAPATNSDVVSITGNGAVTLTPPASGIYQGITIFQNRTSTATVNVSGNGSTNIAGTFYAAHAPLNVSGNGGVAVIGSQYISNTLTVSGNGGIKLNWTSDQSARTRTVGLVE